MNIQPKIEPGSPSTNHVILDREEHETHLLENPHNFEDKTIPDLVDVLRGACLVETFDRVEGVLVSNEMKLRNQIQQLQQNVETERFARLIAEEEVKKREKLCEEGKKVQKCYEALLKEVKEGGLVDDIETIKVLRKRNVQLREMCEKGKKEEKIYEAKLKEAEIKGLVDRDALEEMKKKIIVFKCEVKKLEEKRVEDGNEIRVLRKNNGELENEVLKLKKERVEDGKTLDLERKMKGGLEDEVLELKTKRVEDGKALDLVRKKKGELEDEVLELKKLNENYSNALEELRNKVCVLEDDKKRLVGELKETVNNNLAIISELKSENCRLADEKREVELVLESLTTKMKELDERVSNMEDDTKLFMSGNNKGGPPTDPMVAADFENDTVEAAPLPRTQPQNIGSKYAQGTFSATKRLKMIINIEDEDDDQCIFRGVHEKKAVSGIAMKNEH